MDLPLETLNIIFILDKSGSMASLGNETIQALQAFLDNLPSGTQSIPNTVLDSQNKEQKITKRIIVNTFNENVIHHVDHTYRDNYKLSFLYTPSGMTAAFDGIGFTLSNYLPLLKGKTYVVIVSDGHENASRSYTKKNVTDLIDESKAKGWEFIFLGAHIDAFKEGSALNIHHCGQFDQSIPGNFTRLTRQVSSAISRTATTGSSFEIVNEETKSEQVPLPHYEDYSQYPGFFDLKRS